LVGVHKPLILLRFIHAKQIHELQLCSSSAHITA
jgi:hypothetical protein